MDENKNCVFTVIINDYDNLVPSEYKKLSNWDYICFTDDTNLKSNFWEIIYVENNSKTQLEHIKLSRYYKINFFKYLNSYENLLYCDGNIQIGEDINEYLENLKDSDIVFIKHPFRQTVLEEINYCILHKLEKIEMIEIIKKRYAEYNYNYDNGLIAGGFILFNNNKRTIKFFSEWWDEIKNYSHRDQISANFVLWRNPEIKYKILDVIYDKRRFEILPRKKVYFKILPRKRKI